MEKVNLGSSNLLPEEDLYGKALYDYYNGKNADDLVINTSYGDKEEMPVEVFFRDFDDFPILEAIAIEACAGKVLDVGAGTGCHSLILQEKDLLVNPIDISPYCVEIMQKRGIENVFLCDFFSIQKGKYDTILMLMNGLGVVGKLANLSLFLKHCEKILAPGGKVLFDSSDVSYLNHEFGIEPTQDYIGEVAYQYLYKGKVGNWFDWLYVDKDLMKSLVTDAGWVFELLFEDENQQYLASIQKKNHNIL